MLKKLILISIIYLIWILIYGCCRCPEVIIYCDWKELNTENIDNSGIKPIISLNDTVNKAAYGIKLSLVLDNNQNLTSKFCPVSNVFACSCDEEVKNKSQIDSIKISILEKFDDSHNAGSDLTTYFSARKSDDYLAQYQSIQSIIQQDNISKSLERNKFDIDLYLMKEPENAGLYHFIVSSFFSEQEALVDTIEVYLK